MAPERVYVSNGPDANLYGLEPNFGCCTANMHQGWPKLVANLWMRTSDGGLAAIAYAPSRVETRLHGKPVVISLATDYPFGDTLRFTVETPEQMSFPLRLRIPAWCASAELTVGQARFGATPAGDFVTIAREWSGTTEVRLRLPMRVQLWQGFNDSVALRRGPLVYALRIGEEWRKLKGAEPFADWEVYPKTPWNFRAPGRPVASRAIGAVRVPECGRSSVFARRSTHPRPREGPAAAVVDAREERRGAAASKPRRVV